VAGSIDTFLQPPGSAVSIVLLCLIIELISILIYRKLFDYEKLSRYQREVMKWGNKKTLDRLEKKRQMIEQMQGEVMKANFVSGTIMMIIVLVLLTVMRETMDIQSKVAFIPLIGKWVSFGSWYFIAFLAVSFIFQRFVGIRPRED